MRVEQAPGQRGGAGAEQPQGVRVAIFVGEGVVTAMVSNQVVTSPWAARLPAIANPLRSRDWR